MLEKPYAPSCDRNGSFILEALKDFVTTGKLLEVGSGTGQHAVYCAPHFPGLTWYTSDVEDRHSGIQMWLNESKVENIKAPLAFEVGKDNFPSEDFDYVFTANTLHIMSWEKVEQLFALIGKNLKKEALFMVYGAFNYNGRFTSESNEQFEKWLKDRDPASGLRDFEKIEALLNENGLQLVEDREMPSHNRFQAFCKKSVSS